MPGTAIFRCDASPDVGAGHAVRCLTLATELETRGWRCRVLARPGTSAVVAPFMKPEIEVTELATADDPAVVRSMAPDGCDLLVVDSYTLGAEFERALGGWAHRRLAVDDRPLGAHEVEILLDQTLGRDAGAYDGLVPAATQKLLGPTFALLRPTFAAARRTALTRRSCAASLDRLLVTLGGAPSADVVDVVLAGIEEAGLAAEVHIVGDPSGGARTSGGRGQRVVHDAVSDMHDLMATCDAAIGAAGGSAWERCCLGLPTLLVRIADNQNDVASALAEAGAAVDLGPVREVSPGVIAAALRRLEADSSHRASLAHNAAQICDGLGTRRVAGSICPRRATDGAPVTLRAVTLGDERLTFGWQRIPEVRAHTPTPRPPTWEEHSAWFRQRTGEMMGGPYSIIEYDGRPAGVLRLDRCDPVSLGASGGDDDDAYRVSILVDPVHHGHGIAGAALRAGRDLLPEASFYAEVLPRNDASHRLFRSAGYRVVRPGLYLRDSVQVEP